jgi:hypothetical protein
VTYIIVCRARVDPECYHGQPTAVQFLDENLPMTEDGTYENDGEGGSVVCDPCYIRVAPLTPSGRALLHELPEAIRMARSMGS